MSVLIERIIELRALHKSAHAFGEIMDYYTPSYTPQSPTIYCENIPKTSKLNTRKTKRCRPMLRYAVAS